MKKTENRKPSNTNNKQKGNTAMKNTMSLMAAITMAAALAACGDLKNEEQVLPSSNLSVKATNAAAFHLTASNKDLLNKTDADSASEGNLQVASIATLSAGNYTVDLVSSDATLAPIHQDIVVNEGDNTFTYTFLPVSTSTDLTPIEQLLAQLKSELEACNAAGNQMACKADIDNILAQLAALGVQVGDLSADITTLLNQYQQLLDGQRKLFWPGSVTVSCKELSPGTANNGKAIAGCVVVEPYYDFSAEGAEIKNGGFEEVDGQGKAVGWNQGGGLLISDPKVAANGQHCIKTWHDGRFTQVLKVTNNQPVTIRLKARGEARTP